ncbi:crossover junction endodeoxyribonuclease RuvC [Candidatus Azambacteria bacterium RIFCSPHIGHO2_01_FULL_44_55]|uniref:Crossover junction endodeoxyribonuclease RuvC n=1 Tax=Candidatus Azambacteria bacterium RIFCSPLOWO2_02_FULL_44_14 TaxID=1797306 RepID=A0A1F5CB18_9BACT|nr:MAG: crossover junction endodeoxyribonuclease RuvC [Candidatus Azambacteria bacterium RIFCSPLOWO2_01_FULL_44_84]OGD33031.1 MAG: crossover junction endodeoxyribonuclease RuvC [Candidatus Azambacteria bacterium RIFCSPHIGHO2_02_FULL_45_18]OGD40076.1 MAG: crossover junction endodeoxyribonuclease RuvC [Candidatus Azambacteria bacterium RIFCSPLOWO2_02_FULL_44_14]OGD40922.1 MAG: crossover junction endodeoxyribonuclease RuvC [Candidatus Azambacteria bacterium RIFCSPHIGHO2_01_FULL_44_55]OGD52171.1 MA
MSIILGIDPGTSRIGFAFLEKRGDSINLLEYGCLELAKKRSQVERLKAINDEIGGLIGKHRPETAAVEKLFFSKNTKTALSVAEARGVLLNICAQNGLNLMEFAPTEVKLALTGYGRAEKSQVQKMVMSILKLPKMPQPDDAADAIAVALTACYTNKNLKK